LTQAIFAARVRREEIKRNGNLAPHITYFQQGMASGPSISRMPLFCEPDRPQSMAGNG
jgi:hypothetical protein